MLLSAHATLEQMLSWTKELQQQRQQHVSVAAVARRLRREMGRVRRSLDQLAASTASTALPAGAATACVSGPASSSPPPPPSAACAGGEPAADPRAVSKHAWASVASSDDEASDGDRGDDHAQYADALHRRLRSTLKRTRLG